MFRPLGTLLVAVTLLGFEAATLTDSKAQTQAAGPGAAENSLTPEERESRGRRGAEFARETQARWKEIHAQDVDSLAKLRTDDRLLYLTYALLIGRLIDIGEPIQGLDKIVETDVKRRGEEAAHLLARIFREEPYNGVREYILRWLEWEFSFPAAPILEEARSLYWNEGKKWSTEIQMHFADTLAARGLASDMVIFEDLQKQRGKDWFHGPIQRLQKRIRLGEDRGDATGELPLIPRNTSPTVEPSPLPPFGQTPSPQAPVAKPTNPPAPSTATASPLPAKNSASLLMPIAAGLAILGALLLLWRWRRRQQ